MSRIALGLLLLLVLVGCNAGRSQVVGTWKGKLEPGTEAKPLQDLASALVGEMTLEFNGNGKAKIGMRMSSGVSDYSVSGNEVTIVSAGKDGKPMKLLLQGDTLRTHKEFESDPVLVFQRVSREDPGAKN